MVTPHPGKCTQGGEGEVTIPTSSRENAVNGGEDGIVLIITPGINPVSQLIFHKAPLVNPVIEQKCPRSVYIA